MVKKILLISYHFPPSAEVGGLRAANFAKRLSCFGWYPYVLTLKDRYIEEIDLEKLNYVGNARVFKAGRTYTISRVYLAIKRITGRLTQRSTAMDRDRSESHSSSLKPGESVSATMSRRLRHYLLSFLTLPDSQRNWLWPAVIEAVRVIRRERIGCILTTCPPYSVHLVGLVTKWITGVKWVADFRDPWLTAGSKSLYHTCSFSLGIERWMERIVVRYADRVIANTEMLCNALRVAYDSSPPERFICITNGFDHEFFSRFAHLQRDERFTITYAGSLYFGRTPEPVFKAVHELIQEGRVEPGKIRIRLVGHCKSINGRPTHEMIERYCLGGVVEALDPVSYVDSIRLLKKSHLTLLLAPNQPYQIPAKVYDYMGVGTLVLALAGDGATSDLIRTTGIGRVFSPPDISGIKAFIAESLDRNWIVKSQITPDIMDRFEIHSITRRLVDELDRLRVTEAAPNVVSQFSSIL